MADRRPVEGNMPHGWSRDELLAKSEQLGIDWQRLPALPFFGSLLGYTQAWYRAGVTEQVMRSGLVLRRELTQQETEAVAFHTAKSLVTRSYEVPLFVGTVWLYEKRGRETFRFPFYQPKEGFNPNVFPGGRWPIFSGNMARMAWHVSRGTAYGALTHLFLGGVIGSYASSIWLVGLSQDPRLRGFWEAVRSGGGRPMGDRQPNGGGYRSPAPDRMSDSGASESAPSDSYGGDVPATQTTRAELPGGAAGQRTPESKAPSPPMWWRQQPRPQPQQPQPAEPPARDDSYLFDDDDASPVAPAHRQPQPTTTVPASGSAWARVRQQSRPPSYGGSSAAAAAGEQDEPGWKSWQRIRQQGAASQEKTAAGSGSGSGSGQQQAAGGAGAADDYTYSQADADKAYAREQAQKEFDEMLERERQGESDDQRRRRR